MLRRASSVTSASKIIIENMKLTALLSRSGDTLPGLTGIARVDRNTARLLGRVGPGDIVVLDELDLDRFTADALVEAGAVAVINASPSISGRYPNLGPELLIAGDITLIDSVGPQVFKSVKDGMKIRVYDGVVYAVEKELADGNELTDDAVSAKMIEARNGLAVHLEAFAGNTTEFIRMESSLIIDGVGVPDVGVELSNRHVVVVADGPDHVADLMSIKPFIKEYAPILIGVGAGADTLTKLGYRPDLIIGDPDAITTPTLKSGAEVVLPADPDGRAPGLERIQDLGIGAVTFPSSAGAADLALLLADHHGAALIVAVGTPATLDDFFDRGRRESNPATFLTRLKVGTKLVDGKAVATLYRGRVAGGVIALLVLAALIAVIVAVLVSNTGVEVIDWLVGWWDRFTELLRGLPQ